MNTSTIDLNARQRELLMLRLKRAGATPAPAKASPAAIPRADRDAPQPLSFAQQRLWFLDQLDPEAARAYHIPLALRLTGTLDRAALQAALDRVLTRHDGLRTRFEQRDGQPLQRIEPAGAPFALAWHDLADLADDARDDAVARHLREEPVARFDLSRGPLVRGRLLRLADDEHLLLVTQHHIVSDGWSIGVLARELCALYDAFAQGRPDPLAPLALHYVDYAAWQRQNLQGDHLARQASFWKDQLAGAPALLDLPTDRPRPPTQSHAGASLAIEFPASLAAGLRALGQRHGTTSFMTLLAGWAALMSRLSGQTDVVVGSPVANRPRSELEGLIGFFVNTLALRVTLDDDPTVADLLAQVKQRTLAAYAHQDVPFEQVVDAVQPPRSLSHAPLFQVMLALNNTPSGAGTGLSGLTLEQVELENDQAQFDLSLMLSESGELGLGGALNYDTALFDEATVRRIANRYVRLLQAMVDGERCRVSELSLLDAAERELVLRDFNATALELPSLPLHARFEAQVEIRPQAAALAFEGVHWSYAEVDRRANQVAHRLLALGVQPDDRVAVCAQRSPEMIFALLGILKAGAGYVSLDPAYPADRLAFMLQDSRPRALLTTGDAPATLAAEAASLQVPCIALDASALAMQPGTRPAVAAPRDEHLAYVIYTSGSTGLPKGVLIEHRNASNFLGWALANFSPAELARTLFSTSINFDLHVFELFAPLSCGARITLVRDVLAGTRGLDDLTLINTVPSTIQALLDLGQVPATVGTVNLAGEPLKRTLVERLFAETPVRAVANLYGPSETTTYSTWTRMPREAGFVPHIGRPIANTQVYILDARGEPVPVGVAGEIFIGGDGVARGYLNRPELSAERFVADPFGAKPGARMYRTGDLGRWNADGTIVYLGRNDFQVKIRGFRIELGEIESRLAQCAGVREVAVLAREDRPGDLRLVAYVVGEASTASLREQLARGVADFMIPTAWVALEALPLTPNGKIDRKALPAPDDDAVVQQAYEAPQGELEETIAAVWQDLLGLARVGRHDHFFELGGHSLSAVTLVERLRQRSLRTDVRAVFMHPRVAGFAEALAATRDRAEIVVPPNRIPSDATAITPEMLTLATLDADAIARIVATVDGGAANVQDIYPLTPLQEGILFHHLMETQGDPYLLPSLFAFASRARLDRFLDALQQVIARHDILRTGIAWQGLENPMQVVRRHAVLPVETLHFDGAGDVAARLEAQLDPRHLRIDVSRAPLIHTFLAYDEANGRWLMRVLAHHLAIDHTTLALLIEEAHLVDQGRAAELPVPVPFREFAARSRQGVGAQAHEDFFRRMLADVDEPTAPFGVLDVQGNGDDVTEAHLQMPAAIARDLRTQARSRGVSVASLVHLAWGLVLARISGRSDVVFGSVLLGRMQGGASTDRVLGMLINTLPVRLRVDARGTADALADVQAMLTELMLHENAPLSLAQRCSALPAQSPLFSTLLNYRHTPAAAPEAAPAPADAGVDDAIEYLGGKERTNYPLVLSVDDLGEGFALSAQARLPISPAFVCALMQTTLEQLLLALRDAPTRPIHAVEVLTAAERQRVLVDFNDTATPIPAITIHTRFEQQADAHPDAIALEFEGREWTYAQLDARANQVAHRLLALGVQPDDRVAICAQRSPEMVWGLLGILKAGAGYVPLDPAYPADRLALMLEDCTPQALLVAGDASIDFAAAPVVRLDVDLDEQPTARPRVDVRPDHLAYVIYTSGSTGRPNGVQVEHRNVLRLVIDAGYAPISSDDCIAHCASPSFDASTWELWGALLHGARVLLVAPSTLLDAERLQRVLVDGRVTAMWLTAGLFNQLVDVLAPAFATLRWLLIGGDALDPAIVRRALQRAERPLHLVNGYGPTETTTFATTFDITVDAIGTAGVPIGRPIGNTQVYILDAHGQPVPVGVTGEIFIGGAGVARGYLNRPELTARRFVADPFGAPGSRMYKTGDLGRWRADGAVDYQGRNDFQVKIRGFRVEPGEIEARLAQCAGVRQACVLARQDGGGEKRLVAYLTPYPGHALDAHALRTQLAQHLSEVMIPSAWVMLDALPLTPNGKVDRRALPAPDDSAIAQRAYEAPQGATEQAIAAIWQALLGLERVGRNDHFFELGGHSLMAVQLIARLRQQLSVELGLRALFDHPTLAQLARAIEMGAGPQDTAPIALADRSVAQPLSFAQQRLWFLDQLDPQAGAAYHIPLALRLTGTLDRHALQAALDRVLARHDSLRTRFEAHGDQPRQVIDPVGAPFALAWHDLGALDAEQRDAAVRQHLGEEPAQRFDLAHGPLVRGRLLRLADDEHLLLVTQHHIVSDGWSIGVLARELCALYDAFAQGRPDPLAPLALHYVDYAAWQRQWLQGERLAQQTRFWKDQLTGAPALLDLPTDRPRPATQSHAGASVAVRLPADLVEPLRALGQRHGATLFQTLLAGWAALMARLSGQSDVVVGTPVANRPRPELEGLIGFFANTLALRVTLEDGMDVAQLLAHVRQRTLGAYEHQDLPFEQVVEAVQPPRSLSHAAIFQVMLGLNNTPGAGASAQSGLAVSALAAPVTSAKFDLALSLTDAGDEIAGQATFATDLFDESTVVTLVERWQRVLRAMTDDARQPVDRLAWLGDDERHALVHRFNDTAGPLCDFALLQQAFEHQAALHPDALALEFGDDALSFDALNRRANRVAHALRKRGVGPDVRVGLCLPRGIDAMVALLGVLKAGGGYVPLDPAYPAERLGWMIEDSAPAVVLTRAGVLPDALAGRLACPLLDPADPALAHQPDTDPDPGLQRGEHLAYVIYTSGSTGRPKGVMVQHASVLNLWQALARTAYRELPVAARIGFNAAISFDASVKNLVQWFSGHALVIAPQALRADPAALVQWIRARRLDAFDCTPSQLALMCNAGLLDDPDLHRRIAVIGGEPITPSLWQSLRDAGLRAFNVYGPTECTVDATLAPVQGDSALPTIGGPLLNMQAHVLDRHLQPMPTGVVGELMIGGHGVARGYLNRPELTAERFIADPFSATPGARLYRTGDLVRRRADGTLDYIGRNDHQVKLRGFRIELGEIEAALLAGDGVREAAVIVREDSPGNPRLVAYVVADQPVDVAAMRAALARTLPEHLLPGAIVQLPALPVTPNLKLDRAALPAPDQGAVAARDYEPPQGAIEEAVAAVWQRLLALPRVGRHDDFFELGGHSLLAVQVVAHLRDAIGRDLPLRAVFSHPGLADFAAAAAAAPPVRAGAIRPAPRDGAIAASYAQQRLWFLDRLDTSAGAAFVMPAALRLQGRLDVAALQAALDRVLARHEGLRMRFETHAGEARVCIDDVGAGFALAHRDLSHLVGHERETALRIAQIDEAAQAFDLARGPLVRGQLLRLADDEHVLLLTQHHIVSDGWSTGVLVRELSALYTAFLAGRPDPLPPLAIQYADYAAWQREWLRGDRLDAQTQFWTQSLAGAPDLLELPWDRPRPPVQSHAGDSVGVEIPPALCERLKQLSKRHGATLFMTLLAGWSALLSRLSGQADIVVGTPIANRPRAELESLIGFFANTLALRVDLRDDPSVDTLMERVRTHTLAAYEHQDLPFEQVVESLRPARSLSHSPIFQVLLSLNNTAAAGAGEANLPGLRLSALEGAGASAQFDLVLALSEAGGGLVGTLNFATALFDRTTIERFLAHWQRLLDEMTGPADRRISTLALLSPAERDAMLTAFGGADPTHLDDATFIGWFRANAAAHPERVALECGDTVLTYGQLGRRVDQIARRLVDAGVRADRPVAVCLERGVDLVAGLLAAMQAGAAYLPIDPGLPAARITEILADARPDAVLSLSGQPIVMPEGTGPRVSIDRDLASPSSGTRTTPSMRLPRADDAAYVIYTSGSTGTPKGVVNTHRGLCNLVRAQLDAHAVDASSRVLQFVSTGFDVSVSEIAMALGAGATLVLAPAAALLPVAPLLATLQRHRVTHLSLPVAVLASLPPDADLGSVHTLIVGGEAMPAALAAHWSARCALFNAYGPTEATVCNTVFRCSPTHEGAVPIGRPLPGNRIHILDRHGEPVPIGVIGELHIGGLQVARGYLYRDELSAQRFIPDPFSARAGARLYRTGDLARWQADGQVAYVGRNDFQVKIRGFRIELGEIEARLSDCAEVSEAVVIAREDRPGDKRLVAYVVPGDAHADATLVESLRERLAAQLPAHMVPSAIVCVTAFALTSNGKVDRHALPAPADDDLRTRDYVAPEGEIETAMARIWRELLGVARVGRDDSFFDIGGHSLLAAKLVGRLQQELGLELSLRELFVAPTVRGFAAVASQRLARPASLVPIRPTGSQAPLFLVHPGEGEIGYARELAGWLDTDLPVYGLAARGFVAGEAALGSVEEMAACYLQELRAVQPHGPYRLAGWSAGGLIAYEMANQLLGADEPVEFVGLIDTPSDYAPRRVSVFGTHEAIPRDADAWIASLAWLPAGTAPALREAASARAASGDIDGLLAHLHGAGVFPREIGPSLMRRHLVVRHSIIHALQQYVRPTLTVPVDFFAARDERREDTTLGWQACADVTLRVHPVPGTHHDMVTGPNGPVLARALAQALQKAAATAAQPGEFDYSSKVAIQFGRGAVAPLFCVPGAGASVASFSDLAQALGADVPIYGLQPRGMCGRLAPHIDVQSAARLHLRAIRELRPRGPYHLLGHSFGGWVATEMARQLVAAGEEVATLVVLDSRSPGVPGAARRRYRRTEVLMKLVGLFEEKLQRPLDVAAAELDALEPDAQLARLLASLVDTGLMPRGTRVATLRGLVRAFATNINTAYALDQPYPHRMHVVAATPPADNRQGRLQPAQLIARWREHAPRAELWTSHGNHMTLLAPPHVHDLAKWLTSLLKETQCQP